ncbi:hypothetical protein NW759_007514 [Fusarium solani]|nr:hypothetical protein NW759_007514 [Fusarium solani]
MGNFDLLWAIHGGGGGTFGVIAELTVKAHSMLQATTLLLNVERKTNCTSCWWDLMAEPHALLPALKRQGLQGYYTIGGVPSFPAVTFYDVYFLYNKPNGTMETITKPLLKLLHGANDTTKTASQVA